MPSKSIKQQRLLGAAYAYASGKTKKSSPFIKKIAKSFTKRGKKRGIKSLKDFASTKHKNLPEKVSENHILRFSEI